MIRKLFIIVIVFLLQLNVTAQEKIQAYQIPSKHVSLFFVNDNDCPVKLSNPKFIKYRQGTTDKLFTITNNSNKAIKEFVIKEISWLGNEEFTKSLSVSEQGNFMPYTSFSTLKNEEILEIIEPDEDTLKQISLNYKLKNIWVIQITKVLFDDGTVYDASFKFEKIEQYINKLDINSKMPFDEISRQERKLHKFVNKLMDSD
jgi:hypothetical protein